MLLRIYPCLFWFLRYILLQLCFSSSVESSSVLFRVCSVSSATSPCSLQCPFWLLGRSQPCLFWFLPTIFLPSATCLFWFLPYILLCRRRCPFRFLRWILLHFCSAFSATSCRSVSLLLRSHPCLFFPSATSSNVLFSVSSGSYAASSSLAFPVCSGSFLRSVTCLSRTPLRYIFVRDLPCKFWCLRCILVSAHRWFLRYILLRSLLCLFCVLSFFSLLLRVCSRLSATSTSISYVNSSSVLFGVRSDPCATSPLRSLLCLF